MRKFIISRSCKSVSGGFPSSLEKSVYELLLWHKELGNIKNIVRQDRVSLTKADIGCKIDFSFEDKDGVKIYVEAKGINSERWNIVKKLWRFYGPGELRIYGGHFSKPVIMEVIIPEGEQ